MCWAVAAASFVDAPTPVCACAPVSGCSAIWVRPLRGSSVNVSTMTNHVMISLLRASLNLLSYLHAPGHHGSHRNAGEAGARGAKERAQGSDHSLSAPPVREVVQRGRQQEGTGHCKNTPTLSSFFFSKGFDSVKARMFPVSLQIARDYSALLYWRRGGGGEGG